MIGVRERHGTAPEYSDHGDTAQSGPQRLGVPVPPDLNRSMTWTATSHGRPQTDRHP
jgi:hypothetical protein